MIPLHWTHGLALVLGAFLPRTWPWFRDWIVACMYRDEPTLQEWSVAAARHHRAQVYQSVRPEGMLFPRLMREEISSLVTPVCLDRKTEAVLWVDTHHGRFRMHLVRDPVKLVKPEGAA